MKRRAVRTSASALRQLVSCGRALKTDGFVIGGGGNISIRQGNDVIIKRKGADMGTASRGDYIRVSLRTGKSRHRSCSPSSEAAMHCACYRQRPDITAVIHTHPVYATAVSFTGKVPRIFSYELAVALKRPPGFVPFVRPGSSALARAVAKKIKAHNAVILEYHGLLTVGGDLDEAMLRTQAVERACASYSAARLLGTIRAPKDVWKMLTL